MENTAGAEGATIEEASVPQELFQEPPRLSEGAKTYKKHLFHKRYSNYPRIFRGSYNRITTSNDRIGKSHPREAHKSSRGKSLPNMKWGEPSSSLLEK